MTDNHITTCASLGISHIQEQLLKHESIEVSVESAIGFAIVFTNSILWEHSIPEAFQMAKELGIVSEATE